MNSISFVIPCYGSENTIAEVVKEIAAKLSERPEMDYEIIAVNDCSPDRVWSVLLHLREQNSHIRLLSLSKNMNRPGAVMAGLNYASGDYILIMDDDGQCPMDKLWDLLVPLENGYDVSIAKYPERKQSVFKDFCTFVNKKMTEIVLKRPKDLDFTNFMVMKRHIVQELVKYDCPYPYMTGLLLRTTKYIVNVPMEERERLCGNSTFTLGKMIVLWVNGLTAFSILPLRIATYGGIFTAVIGFFLGLYTVIHKLINPAIPAGYSSLMCCVFFFSGIVMFFLGMIGEYIGRIYICINKSPQFLIREAVGFNTKR